MSSELQSLTFLGTDPVDGWIVPGPPLKRTKPKGAPPWWKKNFAWFEWATNRKLPNVEVGNKEFPATYCN